MKYGKKINNFLSDMKHFFVSNFAQKNTKKKSRPTVKSDHLAYFTALRPAISKLYRKRSLIIDFILYHAIVAMKPM